METENKKNHTYITPVIEHVELDKEISLVLESTPPEGPGESAVIAPEHFNNDFFKNNIG
jgi:hypothetical protein